MSKRKAEAPIAHPAKRQAALAREQWAPDAIANKLSGEHLEHLQREYRSYSKRLAMIKEGLVKHTKELDSYEKSRETILEPVKTAITNSAATAADKQKAIDTLDQISHDTSKITQAKEEFNNAVEALHEAFTEKDRTISNEGIAKTLESKVKPVVDALKAQYEHDKKQIENFFKKPPAGMDPTTIPTLQQEALDKLTQSYEAEVKKVQESVKESVSFLNDIRRREYNEEVVAWHLHHGTKETKEAIQRELDKDKNKKPAMLGANFDPEDYYYSLDGVDFDKLTDKDGKPLMQTLHATPKSGPFKELRTNLQDEPYEKKDGVFTIKPQRWFLWDKLPFSQQKATIAADCIAIAMAVRAQGHEKIELKATSKNQENAEKLARRQFAAAAKAGFDLNASKIEVNGKSMTYQELFKSKPERLKVLLAENEAKRGAKAKLVGPPPPSDKEGIEKESKAIEERIVNFKKNKAAAQKVAPTPPASSGMTPGASSPPISAN